MASAKGEVSIPQLFGEVSKHFKNGDFNFAQKSTIKILKKLPNDPDAMKCKIVCLIQQSCFQEALDSINAAEKKIILSMPFEKAYCMYRLNRLMDSFKVLVVVEEPDLKEKELLAQVQYRLEDYLPCLDLYKDLIKNSADDYGDEREANMAAVVAAARMWKNETIGSSKMRTNTYELSYNYACLQIAQGNLEKARAVLKDALKLCWQSLEADEDITEEEIEEELAVLRAQNAYVEQVQGNANAAVLCYNQILKNKPSDIALTAVISNNVVAAHKDKELFDSKKRLKAMTLDGLKHKLTKAQRMKMQTNICLLHLYTNQITACKKAIDNIKSNFQNSNEDCTALLEAAIYLRDKHNDQAIAHLQSLISSGNKSKDAGLTLAQLYLSKGKIEEAVKAFEIVSDIKYFPAMVSLCVSLYNIMGKKEKAIKYLDEAIYFTRTNLKIIKKEHLLTYLKENANLRLSMGDIENGVKMLEVLREEDSTEIKTLAKIVAAYSQIDIKKAKEYSGDLPELDREKVDMDLDVLEMTDMIGSFRFSKRAMKQSTEKGDSKVEIGQKRKRKKKKKGKLPKNYNPDVDPDPERWLPRWERSTFKHKKQKRGTNTVGKGTQGAVSGIEQPASPKAKSVSPPKSNAPQAATSPALSNVVPPRQQKPGAKSKSKKKKKGSVW